MIASISMMNKPKVFRSCFFFILRGIQNNASNNCKVHFWLHFCTFLVGMVWTIKKAEQKKLEAFQMRCYRKTLNISWQDKVRNDEVWRRISADGNAPELITLRINKTQLTWFGHIVRMKNNRISKRILLETVTGKNRRGRPRKRWENDIMVNSTFYLEYRRAQDRQEWRAKIRGANVLRDMVQD